MWPFPGMTILLLALLLWLVWLPVREAGVQSELRELLVQPENTSERKSAQAANDLNLPLESRVNDGVQSILRIAKEQGLMIAQADYKRHENGHIGRWQLQLPVIATYPQIRGFIRATREIPGLSMDELNLRGTDAGVEARLSFSIWFEVEKPIETLAEGGT